MVAMYPFYVILEKIRDLADKTVLFQKFFSCLALEEKLQAKTGHSYEFKIALTE